jgi:MarR-like DNA-binding transcriptional regulator SgrR of sgrS sRNA
VSGPLRLVAALALAALVGPVSPPADAAGRRPYGGVVRVTLGSLEGLDNPLEIQSPDARWLAAWTHCRLFRIDARGRVRAELARDPGEMRGRSLSLRLVDGARFHGGATVTASDVVLSLQAAARARADDPGRASLGELLGALEFRAPDPTTLEIRAPARTDPNTIRRLLARPEAAVVQGGAGARGHGCGPFRPSGGDGSRADLLAHPGHPEGRPWLDRLEITVRVHARDQSAAFADRDTDLSPHVASRDRRDAPSVTGALVSAFAVVAPRLRGDGARVLRRHMASLARDARLVRHAAWPAQATESLWPPLLAPSAAPLSSTGPALPQPSLVIAFPEADAALGELARGLRDALARLSLTPARAVGIAGLDLRGAASEKDPPWDLAVVSHEWSALDPEQAALELALALVRPGLTAVAALTGRGKAFATAQNEAMPAIPLLHLQRPVHFRPWLALDPGPAGSAGLDLGDAWRRP